MSPLECLPSPPPQSQTFDAPGLVSDAFERSLYDVCKKYVGRKCRTDFQNFPLPHVTKRTLIGTGVRHKRYRRRDRQRGLTIIIPTRHIALIKVSFFEWQSDLVFAFGCIQQPQQEPLPQIIKVWTKFAFKEAKCFQKMTLKANGLYYWLISGPSKFNMGAYSNSRLYGLDYIGFLISLSFSFSPSYSPSPRPLSFFLYLSLALSRSLFVKVNIIYGMLAVSILHGETRLPPSYCEHIERCQELSLIFRTVLLVNSTRSYLLRTLYRARSTWTISLIIKMSRKLLINGHNTNQTLLLGY